MTRVNLELCMPELDLEKKEALVLASLRQSATTAFETPKIWLNPYQSTYKKIVKIRGDGLLEAALKEDKGLIILIPHLGNWEIYNVFFTAYGTMTALYQPSRKTYLAEMMKKIRSGFGNVMVPTNRAGVTQLYKRLKSGEVVSILPDQVPSNGLYIPFFGVAALTDNLTSRLLRKTGANVLCLYVIRTVQGFEVNITSVADDIYVDKLETSLKAINETVEACVKEAPDQYQWDYKRFRERPAGEKKIYGFNKPEAYHQ